MSKLISSVLLTIVLCGVVFLSTCLPTMIDTTYQAVQFNENHPELNKNITVIMEGRLFQPLFSKVSYTGSCVIEGYDFTREYNLTDVTMDGISPGFLHYFTTKGGLKVQGIGFIWFADRGDAICISGVAPQDMNTPGGSDPMIIAAPAASLSDAVSLMNRLKYGNGLVDLLEVLSKCSYIVLGIISILLGKNLSKRVLLPSSKRYKVMDEQRFLRSARGILYILGIYYMLLGRALLSISKEPGSTLIFKIFIPFLIFIPILYMVKKYTRPVQATE